MRLRAELLAALVALLSTGCGDEVPRGGIPRVAAGAIAVDRRVEPTHLLPADLDLVVRVDLARLRAGLGPTSLEAVAARLPGDALLRQVLARADAVTIGLRADDLEAGDRVVVVEGTLADGVPSPDATRFAPASVVLPAVRVWDATAGGALGREQVARIMRVDDRALVFVTALEVDPTTRVLRDGPDQLRGQPFAEGLVSLDWRPRPLRTSLAQRYPSIASVLRGIVRVRATAAMGEAAVELRAEIEASDEAAAIKAGKFLELLRDNAGDGAGAVLGTASIERAGATLHLTVDVPAEVVLRAVADPPG